MKVSGPRSRAVAHLCRAVEGDKKSLRMFKFERIGAGGVWTAPPPPVADQLLKDLVAKVYANVLDISLEYLPVRLFNINVADVMAELYDAQLIERMDGPATCAYLCFSYGRMWNRDAAAIEPNRLEHYISQTTGYSFPEQQINSIKASDRGSLPGFILL